MMNAARQAAIFLGHQLRVVIVVEVAQPHDRSGEPRRPTGLLGALRIEKVRYVRGLMPDTLGALDSRPSLVSPGCSGKIQ